MFAPLNEHDPAGQAYHLDDPQSRQRWAFIKADQLFRKLKWQSFLNEIWNRFTRRPNRLADLDSVLVNRKIQGSFPSGIQTIPVHKIIGSEGRSQDFDPVFRPRREHDRLRWTNIATLLLIGKSLPPISVIRVGPHYIVRDGNHRVSVVRALGQKSIEAEVITLQTTGQPEMASSYCSTPLPCFEAA